MSGCINKVFVGGYVGKDPNVRPTRTGGDKMASFSLAINKNWRDRDSGERKQITTWVNVVCFNKGVTDIIEQYVKKGSHILVQGEMAQRDYRDDQGVDRRITEVVIPAFGTGAITLLDNQGNGNRAPDADDYSQYGQASGSVGGRTSPGQGHHASTQDDEVPF